MAPGLVERDPPVGPAAVVPVTFSAKSPSVVVAEVATVSEVVVGDAELEGKATELASVVVASLVVLRESDTLAGSPVAVDPGVRLTATV